MLSIVQRCRLTALLVSFQILLRFILKAVSLFIISLMSLFVKCVAV